MTIQEYKALIFDLEQEERKIMQAKKQAYKELAELLNKKEKDNVVSV